MHFSRPCYPAVPRAVAPDAGRRCRHDNYAGPTSCATWEMICPHINAAWAGGITSSAIPTIAEARQVLAVIARSAATKQSRRMGSREQRFIDYDYSSPTERLPTHSNRDVARPIAGHSRSGCAPGTSALSRVTAENTCRPATQDFHELIVRAHACPHCLKRPPRVVRRTAMPITERGRHPHGTAHTAW